MRRILLATGVTVTVLFAGCSRSGTEQSEAASRGGDDEPAMSAAVTNRGMIRMKLPDLTNIADPASRSAEDQARSDQIKEVAEAYRQRHGRWPSSVEMLRQELKEQGKSDRLPDELPGLRLFLTKGDSLMIYWGAGTNLSRGIVLTPDPK